MDLLELRDITFRANGKYILNGLSLTVRYNEVHALLGTNGTGKSTLAYLIMGCSGYKPSSGEILFEGKKINELTLYERAKLGICLAWQEPVRFEGISVRDYISVHNKDIDPAPFLELVGLHPELYLDREVDKTLSGGERKRIELASVLALNPKLAILDEPDSGIDMLSTDDIIRVIEMFKKSGSSVLLITHREEIALISDRASQLCGGRIFYSGEPERVAEMFKSRRCLICDGEVCKDERD